MIVLLYYHYVPSVLGTTLVVLVLVRDILAKYYVYRAKRLDLLLSPSGGLPGSVSVRTGDLYSSGYVGCLHSIYIHKSNFGQEINFANGDSMVRNIVGVDCTMMCTP